MSVIRFDPKKHPRNRKGWFITTFKKLDVGDSMRLPNFITVTKRPDGKVRVSSNSTSVDASSPASAYKLATKQVPALQDDIDVLIDEIEDIDPEGSADFDTPKGSVTVGRQLKRDPDGWEFDVGSEWGLSSEKAAERIAKARAPEELGIASRMGLSMLGAPKENWNDPEYIKALARARASAPPFLATKSTVDWRESAPPALASDAG